MNTKRTIREYPIVSGPNRDTILDAFKYAYDRASHVDIDFFVSEGLSMPEGHPGAAEVNMDVENWHMTSIQHEDGSGHSFNLEGWCCPKLDGKRVYADFKACYNARTRKGTITFIPNE